MADTKITALTAIGANPIIPSTFPIPMVDLTDTSMAASGTTKKVTVNQILQAGGTATLASATITGDLTVDTNVLKVDTTNNRVGVNTASPATDLEVRANGTAEGTIRLYSVIDGSTASPKGSYFSFRSGTTGGGTETARLSSLNRFSNVLGGDFSISTADTSNVLQNRLTIDSGGVFTFAVGGSTAMTLNSTGLGVGVSPTEKLSVNGSASFSGFGINANPLNPVSTSQRQARFQNTGGDFYFGIESSSAGGFFPGSTAYATCFYNATATPLQFFTNGSLKATIDTSGNLILRSSATPATLATNGELTVNATSNTNLRFSYRGSDGVTRVADITLT